LTVDRKQVEMAVMKRLPRPWIIAHRGMPTEVPENTLIGFERAIRHGADLIELDVRQTADGHIVVIHDETLDRTTNGSGAVSATTLADLQVLDAGSWMGRDFEGEKIPTLAEVLALTEGRAGVVIELKAGSKQYPNIEKGIVSLVARTDRLDDVIIISADSEGIASIRQLNRQIATLDFGDDPFSSQFWEKHAGEAEPGSRYRMYVFGYPEDITAEFVDKAHRSGIGVLTSLLAERILKGVLVGLLPERMPTPARVAQLVQAGVDGIFTNDPLELRKLLLP
jgi:glycerophosphoryl diester phosphodiesterase